MKLFLDANIMFSGSNENSNLHQLLMLLHQEHELITNEYAFDEAERNIAIKFPHWKTGFDTLMNRIQVVPTVNRLDSRIQLRNKDRPILSSAIEYQCDYLMTGDKRDFGHLFGETFGNTTVATALMIASVLIN